MRPPDPLGTFNFSIEVEGLQVGGFTEVGGLESAVEMVTHQEGGVNGYTHQLPGRAQLTNLRLKRGLAINSSLWDWYEDTLRGTVHRRNGSITLHDAAQAPLVCWNFRRGLPVRWTGPEIFAAEGRVGFESIEIVHEGLSRIAVGRPRG